MRFTVKRQPITLRGILLTWWYSRQFPSFDNQPEFKSLDVVHVHDGALARLVNQRSIRDYDKSSDLREV